MIQAADRAQTIFLNALEISSVEVRRAYVDAECRDDESLRREVDELLEHAERMGDFLGDEDAYTFDADFTTAEPITRVIGTEIGPYKIREKIAEGGMGSVYVAEQSEPVRRKVALKVIRPGLAGPSVVARFEAERQALAMMDHPNIARVLDGGSTEDGLPYFVMELVQGLPITEYCDQKRLTTRERLELFVDVCHAVQHAHQKGIIHRDLKPTNILVAEIDGKSVPKVIDFGVAKALHQKLTDQTVYTQFSQMIGTPLYMSPEQAGMGVVDVDTRSDVYSLGVVLYELLTGETPFDRERLKDATFDEMRRIIREEVPKRPSAMVSTLKAEAQSTIAERRGIDVRKLSGSLTSELDWLVMKALDKDRGRRYESANAMAADLQRFLGNEPIEAGPPTTAYRFKKFVQRKRGPLLVASLVTTVILTGLLTYSRWKWRQYQTQLQVKGDIEQNLSIADAAFTNGEWDLADRKLSEAKSRLEYSSENRSNMAAQVDAIETKIHKHQADLKRYVVFEQAVNQIWTSTYYKDEFTGPVQHALGLFGVLNDKDWIRRLESSSLSALQKESVKQSAYELLILMAYEATPKSEGMKYLESAESFYLPTVAFYIARAQAFQAQKDNERAAADRERIKQLTDSATAFDHFMAGQFASRAKKDPEQAIQHYERALLVNPDHVRSLFFLANRLREVGREAEAIRVYQACLAIKPDLRVAWNNLGGLYHNSGKFSEALIAADRGIEAEPSRAMFWRNRGLCHSEMGNLDLALKDCEKAVELDPNDSSNYMMRGVVYAKQGKLDEAFEDFNKSIEIDAKNAMAFSNRGEAHSMLGRTSEAIDDLSRSLVLFAELDAGIKRERNLVIANTENLLAWLLITCADSKTRDPQRAIELATQANSRFPTPNANVLSTLGVARYRVEDFDGAIESLEKAEELSPGQYSALNGLYLAMAHAKLGQKAEAQQWYEKAVAWIDAHGADDELQRCRAEADQLLESLEMLPAPSGERRMGHTGEEDTRADQPPAQPGRSTEPVSGTAGADPS